MSLDRRPWRSVGTHETRVVTASVYAVALAAWLALVLGWVPMPSGSMAAMDGATMADPGVPERLATTSGATGWVLYLLMWAAMMVAMMFPSSVPLVRLYAKTLDGVSQRRRAARLGAFLGTYALVWTATGVVPLLANAVVPISTVADRTVLLGGSLVLLAGYQLSPYKDRCLDQCRSPLGFLMQHHHGGVEGAARMGFAHSKFCVGCCWALFAFMVVVGTMNLLWMAAITVVLSLERTVRWGDSLSKAVGWVAGVVGVALLLASVV